MIRHRLKIILALFTIVSTLLIMSVASAFFSIEDEMTQKLEQKKFLQPTEFFAAGPSFASRQIIDPIALEKWFAKELYRRREVDQTLLPGDFFRGERPACEARLGAALEPSVTGCFAFVRKDVPPEQAPAQTFWLLHDGSGVIFATLQAALSHPVTDVTLEPVRFAQYLGQEPLMQEQVPLGEVPTSCLNAVIAIEDQKFLEHGGFSVTGFARAAVRNLLRGKPGQGGSTITQQLVKNYFLTSEKTIKRKLYELIMSVLLETKFTKDQILETYLNIIYMGQNGAFRVHGYGSASRYYFGKSVRDLELPECALLAAIVNNPGGLNPWKKSDAVKARRSLVLSKMEELKLISPAEAAAAKTAALPAERGQALATETAPYFIDAVRKQMRDLDLPLAGVRIYTSLDLNGQQTAQEALQGHLAKLETDNKYIQGLKAKGKSLEGLILSGDPRTGLVQVAVGGRSYRMTQFNRAVDSRRQVGSIMKPVVALAALQTTRKDGSEVTPTTLLDDTKFETSYDRQKWSPENYEKKYEGQVPLFFALKRSLNAATASLGLEIGLDRVVAAAQQLGVTSPLKPLPSLTLGAYEMTPKEVLLMSMTLATLGQRPQVSFIRQVVDSEGHTLFEHQPSSMTAVDPVATAILVGMMKQVILSGSGRAITASGFTAPAAGKTGTTNDYRDTWFMGFTPLLSTVVWVGYDDNTQTKLTGSSGAVPVWLQFMKKAVLRYPPEDFPWPEGTEKKVLSRSDLEALHAFRETDPDTVELIFKK